MIGNWFCITDEECLCIIPNPVLRVHERVMFSQLFYSVSYVNKILSHGSLSIKLVKGGQ